MLPVRLRDRLDQALLHRALQQRKLAEARLDHPAKVTIREMMAPMTGIRGGRIQIPLGGLDQYPINARGDTVYGDCPMSWCTLLAVV